MMLVVANLLIYAMNCDFPKHRAARSWLENTFSGSNPIGLPWVAVLAFLRLCTNPRPRVFAPPVTAEQTIFYVYEWLALPAVTMGGLGLRHWAIFRTLLTQPGTAGNLTTDAHIAALALEGGYGVYSADNVFTAFRGSGMSIPWLHKSWCQ